MALVPVAVLALAGCTTTSDREAVVAVVMEPVSVTTAVTTTTVTTTTTAPPTTSPVATEPPDAPAVAVARADSRIVTEQAWTPFATVGGITLRHTSSRVERVGFHDANHDGARQMEPLSTAVAPWTMESRDRLTGSRSAADVVVDPAVEIRSPVSGTVLEAGTYVLYCDYSDDYVVIDPDDHPGWRVKILHIDGVQVGAGDTVVAGETVLAGGPTQLPFGSQVDEVRTADPAWPHTHVEVVDPS
ncbi:MAG: hypothetical protein ACR2HV_04340, partial [Acidimicrobiales bacterium]